MGSGTETSNDRCEELERALAQALQRLGEVEALAQVGSWEWDVSADHVIWSDELYRIFGLKPDDFQATFSGYLSRLHPADQPRARANVEQALATSGSYAEDYRVICPDGEERWIHCRGRAITSEDGNVERLIGTSQDITDRRRLETDLLRRATHDGLTGLPNKTLLRDRITHALRRGARTNEPTVVFFIDVDNLKTINDGAGHDVGDEALVELARRLRLAVRGGDTVARYGGDEFVVVAEGLRLPGDARAMAQRLVESCAFSLDHASGEIDLTASVGGAVAEPSATADEVLREADSAMYAAKSRRDGTIEIAGLSRS
jgi:diguanylate cyclase (GGDEF)-like protein/PAS domain S-box-containing protein